MIFIARKFYICLLIFFLGCSSKTHFASVSLISPTGEEIELDKNYCSKKNIKEFEESAKSYESISIKTGNYDPLDLEQNRLDATNYRFFAKICSLIAKGYILTNEGKELALEQRQLYEKRKKLREEHHQLLDDSAFDYDNENKVDTAFRKRIENGKQIKTLQAKLLKELVQP